MNSCNKDLLTGKEIGEKIILRSSGDYFAFETNDVSLVNGMLYFEDSMTLRKVIESLESLNKDSVFISNYLTELGLDEDDYLENDYPWNPAFQKFNERFGFNSLGKVEEQREKTFLKNGGDPANFDYHFIKSDLRKFLLNQELEVRVGDNITKEVNEDIFYLIINNDLDALNKLREATDLTMYPDIKDVLRVNGKILDDINRFDRYIGHIYKEEEGAAPPECFLSLRKENIGTNIIRIYAKYNTLFNAKHFQWKITDASGYIVFTSNQKGFIDFEKPIPYNGPYNVSLSVDFYFNGIYICEGKDDRDFDFPDENPCVGLSPQLLMKGDINGWDFEVYIPDWNGYNYDVTWDFGDGTIVQGNYVDNHYIFHDFEDSDYFTESHEVCVTLTWNGSQYACQVIVCKTLDLCGQQMMEPFESTLYKPKDKLEYELYIDRAGILYDYDKMVAKSKNYHFYQTWLLDFWWRKDAKALRINHVANPVKINCKNENKQLDLGINNSYVLYNELNFLKNSYFTTSSGSSFANFWVYDDNNTMYGPYHLSW